MLTGTTVIGNEAKVASSGHEDSGKFDYWLNNQSFKIIGNLALEPLNLLWLEALAESDPDYVEMLGDAFVPH